MKIFQIEKDVTLRRIIDGFYFLHIWVNVEESANRRMGRTLFFTVQHILFLTLLFTYGIVSEDTDRSIFYIEVGVGAIVILLKLDNLLHRKKEISEFLYDSIVTHRSADYSQSLEINKKLHRVGNFIALYVFFMFIAYLVCSCVPLFMDDKVLPLFIQFDLGTEYDGLLYCITYAFLISATLYSLMFNILMLFVWYIMYNYSIEWNVLGNQLRHLGHATKENSVDVSSGPSTQNSYLQELIRLIKAHYNLLETIERFRSLFAMLFLVEILTGAVLICGATYSLAYSSKEEVLQLSFFVIVLLWVFFDIFLIMYLANEITLQSGQLAYCAFESNWMDQSESAKKYVIIWCEMIKQPLKLAVFIYPMNLEKFSAIVNGAYSMFNVLKNVE